MKDLDIYSISYQFISFCLLKYYVLHLSAIVYFGTFFQLILLLNAFEIKMLCACSGGSWKDQTSCHGFKEDVLLQNRNNIGYGGRPE